MRAKKVALATMVLMLAGCSGKITMMPRDSGKTYMGTVEGNGFGSGTFTIPIDGETYTGVGVRTTTNETFGFAQTYGTGQATAAGPRGTVIASGSGSTFGSSYSDGGTKAVKAILSSPSGKGLRCDFTSTGNGGGGICVDDKKRVYDAVVYR